MSPDYTVRENTIPELAFDSEWSLGEQAYQAVVADLKGFGARQIVEFGSGISTIRFTHDFPEGAVFSLDADAHWFEESKKLQRHQGPGEAKVELRPLKLQVHALSVYESYELGPFPDDVDAVLIDGPPIATRRGREACLYQVMSKLKVGGRVYLDDYCRDFEQTIVENWLHAYPGSLRKLRVLNVGHDVCVLEKIAEADAPQVSVPVLLDTNKQNLKRLIHRVRKQVGLLPKP